MDASKSSRSSPCTCMQIGFFNRTTNSLDMRVALSTCSNCPAIDNGTHAARCEVCHFLFSLRRTTPTHQSLGVSDTFCRTKVEKDAHNSQARASSCDESDVLHLSSDHILLCWRRPSVNPAVHWRTAGVKARCVSLNSDNMIRRLCS